MLPFFKNKLVSTYCFAKKTGHAVQQTIEELPNLVRSISSSPNLGFLVKNIWLMNWQQFALPMLTASLLSVPWEDEEETTSLKQQALLAALSSGLSVWLYLYQTRKKIELIALHNTAISLSNSVVQGEYQLQYPNSIKKLCHACKVDGNRLKSEISFLLQYLFAFLIITVAAISMRNTSIPLLNSALPFLLDAYFKGFIAFQYPFASMVCADHQMQLLTDNKAQLIGFGISQTAIESMLVHTAYACFPNPQASIISTAIRFSIARLSMIHAHQICLVADFKLPNNEVMEQQNPYQFLDPMILSWLLARQSVTITTLMLKDALVKEEGNCSWIEKKMREIQEWKVYVERSLFYPYAQMIPAVFLPGNLRNLKAFLETETIEPFTTQLIEVLEPLLEKANDLTESMSVKTGLYLLAMPGIGRIMIAASSLYAHQQAGFSPTFTRVLLNIIGKDEFLHFIKWFKEQLQIYKPGKHYGRFFQPTAVAVKINGSIAIEEGYMDKLEEPKDDYKKKRLDFVLNADYFAKPEDEPDSIGDDIVIVDSPGLIK